MVQTLNRANVSGGLQYANANNVSIKHTISCKWEPLREQILSQWPDITLQEIEGGGANLKYLSMLISTKYNLNELIIFNYLRNVERYMPLT